MKNSSGSVNWNGNKFLLSAVAETTEALKKAAIYTQGVAKDMVGGSGAGRSYKRKGGAYHKASLPGRPPARDSGILLVSVSYTVKKQGLKISAYVGSDKDKMRKGGSTVDPEYGFYLEKGTKTMAARPWLRPALIKSRPRILKILKKALK